MLSRRNIVLAACFCLPFGLSLNVQAQTQDQLQDQSSEAKTKQAESAPADSKSASSAARPPAQVDTSKLSYDARLTNYNYAWPAQMFAFTSQNQQLEMAYIYLKGDGSKPVVTLLHGKNFNADYWEPTARHLLAQGYSVLMVDQIGFGKSSKPAGYQYSFAALAHNTRLLQDSLNIKESIILGHSMGGMLAVRYALLYPEQTQKLVLVNPIGLENYLQYVQYKDVQFFYESELKAAPAKIKAYQQKNYYDGKWNPTYDKLTHYLIGQVQGPDWKQLAWVNALTYDMIFTQPVVTDFANIKVSTTLIVGTRDRTGPGRGWMRPNVKHELGRYDLLGKQTEAIIPHATLHEIQDSGHLPQYEKPKVFFKLLDETLAGK